MDTGVVLLAGGKSRRMGFNKAGLMFSGESFLDRIVKQLEGFEEKILSVGTGSSFRINGFTVIQDFYPECGPIGGLHAALKSCRSDALLAVTCDMPLFQRQLGNHLIQCLTPDYDAVIIKTRDGRLHPFCGVYRKRMADLLEQQILSNELCLMKALEMGNLCSVDLSDVFYHDNCLVNINTIEDYIALLKQEECLFF